MGHLVRPPFGTTQLSHGRWSHSHAQHRLGMHSRWPALHLPTGPAGSCWSEHGRCIHACFHQVESPFHFPSRASHRLLQRELDHVQLQVHASSAIPPGPPCATWYGTVRTRSPPPVVYGRGLAPGHVTRASATSAGRGPSQVRRDRRRTHARLHERRVGCARARASEAEGWCRRRWRTQRREGRCARRRGKPKEVLCEPSIPARSSPCPVPHSPHWCTSETPKHAGHSRDRFCPPSTASF